MFRSRAVAKVKPSSSCNTVLILGNGNGFLTSSSFTLLKSVRNRTVPFFFGCINDGEAHSDVGCHSSTPNSTSRLTSFLIVSLWTLGIGKALVWYGFAPLFNSKYRESSAVVWRGTTLQFEVYRLGFPVT